MKNLQNAIQAALSLVVLVFFLAFAAWFTVPRLMGWHPQVILSGSMEPALPLGGVAFVKPVSPEAVHIGDVLTFRHPEQPTVLVTHRVTEVVSDEAGLSFRTKGDANEDMDQWLISAASVIGTVQWKVPYLGYVTQQVRTSSGFLLIVGLPAAIVILGEIQNIVKELKKPRPEKESAT